MQFYILQFSNPFLLLPRSASTQMLMLSWSHPKRSCTLRCRTLLLKLASHRYWSLSSTLTRFFWELITQTIFNAILSVMSVLSVVKLGQLNTIFFVVPVCGGAVGVSRSHGEKCSLQEVQTRCPCKQTCQAVVSTKHCWYLLVIGSLLFIYWNDLYYYNFISLSLL